MCKTVEFTYLMTVKLNCFFRNVLAYLMVPTIQQEIDKFVDVVWNTHRIREQRNTLLPDGIPNHIYDFPEQYGLQDCGKGLL